MPTIFSHAAFALITTRAGFRKSATWPILATAAFCSIAPDFDVAAFAFGIPYGSMFGHRGFTHSIAFAVLLGAISAIAYKIIAKPDTSLTRLFVLFSLATLSHPLLDMLTNGGLGVALFAPFSGERYFSPWRPMQVSPIGADFVSWRGIEVILSEIIWAWLPALLFYLAAAALRKFARRRQKIN